MHSCMQVIILIIYMQFHNRTHTFDPNRRASITASVNFFPMQTLPRISSAISPEPRLFSATQSRLLFPQLNSLSDSKNTEQGVI